MAFGTESFTDRYGDYKQPTIIDYDNQVVNNSFVVPISEEDLNTLEINKENILKDILSINPFFARDRYAYLVVSTKDNKLTWAIEKIKELSKDINWLISLKIYLNKCKNNYYKQ